MPIITVYGRAHCLGWQCTASCLISLDVQDRFFSSFLNRKKKLSGRSTAAILTDKLEEGSKPGLVRWESTGAALPGEVWMETHEQGVD